MIRVGQVAVLSQQHIGVSEVLMGFLQGIFPKALFPRPGQVIDRLADCPGLLVMIGKRFIDFRQTVAKQGLHRLADPFVNNLSLLLQESVVDHFLGQGMLEDELDLRLQGFGLNEIKPFQPAEAILDIVSELGDPFEDGV